MSDPALGLRVGLGFDVHAFGGDGPLVLGGVTIPDARGLEGHSDADVVAHAVGDALLGALGLPDLGTLFPASNEAYRGASSIDLLREVMQHVTAEGWSVVNVDAVIAAEQPDLAEHLNAMVLNLSNTIGAPVNVKPKRGEGVGAVGRGEGIAAWAVALLAAHESNPPS
jgi:2-C-methyl-D-erythritol 2,4-cyclodiphosphate synthase